MSELQELYDMAERLANPTRLLPEVRTYMGIRMKELLDAVFAE